MKPPWKRALSSLPPKPNAPTTIFFQAKYIGDEKGASEMITDSGKIKAFRTAKTSFY